MKTLQDVIDYLEEKDAPSELIQAVKDSTAALEAAQPYLAAYGNGSSGDDLKSPRLVDAVIGKVPVTDGEIKEPDETSHCDNCDATWHDEDLDEISDLWERVEPGGIMPSGQCPDCGALCYPAEACEEPGQAPETHAASEQAQVVITSVEDQLSLWIDFGSGEVERFDFASADQLEFFQEGACTVLNRLGLDDVHAYETEQAMLESYDERPEIIVNPPFVKGGA